MLPIAPPFLSTVHAQISDYIAKNNLVRPIIVGHSMGGMMALWLAETIANLGAVVDVDASPFLAGETNPLMTEAQAIAESIPMRDQMLSLSPTQLEEQIRQSMRGGTGTREDFDRVVAEAAKSDVVTAATAFAEGRSKDLHAHLGTINTPVTIIAATMTGLPTDQLMARWHTQVAAIRDVDLVFIAARHFVMLDQPDAFYALLDKAIASAT